MKGGAPLLLPMAGALVLACCAARAPAARPGIRFDPATLAPGDRVGSLVVESLERQRAVDGSWVGSVRFRGELTLTGRRFPHPDPEFAALCFEADPASAATLPRWAGDERRPWLCFEGPPPASVLPEGPVTVVIDRFAIHRGLSDQVNGARLLRVLSRTPYDPGNGASSHGT
jgi:hypothetical protein